MTAVARLPSATLPSSPALPVAFSPCRLVAWSPGLFVMRCGSPGGGQLGGTSGLPARSCSRLCWQAVRSPGPSMTLHGHNAPGQTPYAPPPCGQRPAVHGNPSPRPLFSPSPPLPVEQPARPLPRRAPSTALQGRSLPARRRASARGCLCSTRIEQNACSAFAMGASAPRPFPLSPWDPPAPSAARRAGRAGVRASGCCMRLRRSPAPLLTNGAIPGRPGLQVRLSSVALIAGAVLPPSHSWILCPICGCFSSRALVGRRVKACLDPTSGDRRRKTRHFSLDAVPTRDNLFPGSSPFAGFVNFAPAATPHGPRTCAHRLTRDALIHPPVRSRLVTTPFSAKPLFLRVPRSFCRFTFPAKSEGPGNGGGRRDAA